MHKNFWNSNKVHPVIANILTRDIGFFEGKKTQYLDSPNPAKFDLLESKMIQNLIENRVKIIGNYLPIKEDKIKERLLNFVKKNRVAMRYEQACSRHIKQFSSAVFLFCEVCDEAHEDLKWYRCKNCGSFNKYQI
jgi:hypothetical protein